MKDKPLNVFEAPLTDISLVEASAGTGKTYNITSLYVRAILERDLDPSQLLVMTYTEAAIAELKTRLRSRLQESLEAVSSNDPKDDEFLKQLIEQNYPEAAEKLKSAIDLFDESAVFTIHGFCNRLLGEYSLHFDVPPNFDLLTDATELLQECVDDYWRSFIQSVDTDEINWFILDYLTDTGFGPDELRKAVDAVMTHPGSKVVPADISTSGLKPTLEQLKDVFKQLKHYWEEDGKQISDMYLNGKLHGGKYRESNVKYERWQSLESLLNGRKAKIGVDSDHLRYFGMYMKDEGSYSEFTVPDLSFFAVMDRYIEITEELKLLKPAFIKESVSEIKSLFKGRKKTYNLLTYNDLLEVVESGIRSDKTGFIANRLAKKYPLALIDEFQDTDPIQYSIFRLIYEGHSETGLFMIGDPKQAIYGFRGADIFTYISAKKDAHSQQSYNLLHNYRSNTQMIKGVNSLFAQSSHPFLIEDIPFVEAQFPEVKKDFKYLYNKSGEVVNPLQFITLGEDKFTNKEVLKGTLYPIVVKEISHLLSGDYLLKDDEGRFREVQEKDIAVLVKEGKEGEAVQEALRELGINSVLRSRTSVFKSQEGNELFRILYAIQHLSSESAIRTALSTNLLGFTAEGLLEFNEDETGWNTQLEIFSQLKTIWEQKGIQSAVDKLFRLFEVIEQLSSQRAAERRITNLMHISELLSKAELEQRLNPKTLLKWFYTKINDENTQASSDEEQLRLESDEDLVQITTIHSSKGLQYPIVFCPFMWYSKAEPDSKKIHTFNDEGQIHVDISQNTNYENKDSNWAKIEFQNKAEEVRLAYVALTRSISACYVFLPNYKSIGYSPISFILNGRDGSQAKDFYSVKASLEEASHIELRPGIQHSESALKHHSKPPKALKAASFSRSDLFNFPRMLSYSSLSGTMEHQGSEKDYDERYELIPIEKKETKDRFGFPKGANAGTCLHKIFEDISFEKAENLSKVVSENLEFHGIDGIWDVPTTKWIREVLGHQLVKEPIMLSSLSEELVLKEMEFFFPVQKLRANMLWNTIRPNAVDSDLPESVDGFMKGYIDLIFRTGDRFYILDYKSNYLGDSPEDYSAQQLDEAMKESGYDLQYHIYTLALHRYLNNKMPSYNYDTHFGGVMYLFLRGVESEVAGSGVYFDKPKIEIVDELDRLFKGGSE